MRNNPDTHTVAVIVTPHAPLFELAVPCEVFGIDRSDLVDPWYRFRICTLDGPVTTAHGFITPDASGIEDFAAADTLIVPACADHNAPTPEPLIEALQRAHARGARIASICAGAFALADAGLLIGKRATTHWMYADDFRRRFPTTELRIDKLCSSEGRIHTSAGTAAGLDLCLELVRQDHGTAVASALARRIVTPPHRDGGQSQYIATPIPEPDGPPMSSLLEWASEHLDDSMLVTTLARRMHLSERQFRRKFFETVGTTPGEWLSRERTRRAQQLLETTDLTIDQVAASAGYNTTAGLRAAFRRRLNTTPSDYRRLWTSQSS